MMVLVLNCNIPPPFFSKPHDLNELEPDALDAGAKRSRPGRPSSPIDGPLYPKVATS